MQLDDEMWYIVTDKENELCRKVLNELIEDGEDPYKIMGFRHGEHDYYVEKLINGLCPFSSILFYRIVGRRPLRPIKMITGTVSEYVIKTTCSGLEKI